MSLVIGLIGGLGSGKSTVAEAFARRGGQIVSGDKLGHEALAQPEIRDRVKRRWGPGVLDESGRVVRSNLGAIVFADAAERRALEAIVHPWIGQRLEEEISRARTDPAVAFVVLDAAIMLETGWNKLCDRLVFVDAPAEVRRQRLTAQRGWTTSQVAAREQAQMPLTEKKKHVDAVLDNSGSPEQVEQQIDDLLRRWGVTS